MAQRDRLHVDSDATEYGQFLVRVLLLVAIEGDVIDPAL